ncbi:proprotein convertase subtilisin/kexin type 6-like isoform X3 [Petromyzon marinus]|uniref:proprotein convertase subtilisin/kexin type 6-like isoform X3 n=1 Tax=Petromyzon marinus TaxID=7757 RepID=UPI003F724155
MRSLLPLFAPLLLLGIAWGARAPKHYTNRWAVSIEGGPAEAQRLADKHGFVNLGQIGSLDGFYHFHRGHVMRRSALPSHGPHLFLRAEPQVKWMQQQTVKRRVKRDLDSGSDPTAFNDPKWPYMWYMHCEEGAAHCRPDMGVGGAWRRGFTGKGVVITILDDGIERTHPDLQQNYDPAASYDVNGNDWDPMPRYDANNENKHGTRCAGEVAATANNSQCTVGIAYHARIGGVRMLDGEVTDAVEGAALSVGPQHVAVFSASWGPDDDGATVDGPGLLASTALLRGVREGRGGLGSIFVWASGNGGRRRDHCSCDGYTNSVATVSVSSTAESGAAPWYLEACASTLASTYSSGEATDRKIITTDLRQRCTENHTGTSASAPMAAAIIALALEANPRLTWRDVQHLVVRTSRPAHLVAPDWTTNGAGRRVSHLYGFGLMNAEAMVVAAASWRRVPEQRTCRGHTDRTHTWIRPEKKLVAIAKVSGCRDDPASRVAHLEHVVVRVTLTHVRRGDLAIFLTSPAGTRSQLLANRMYDHSQEGFKDWEFMTSHCWGEAPGGVWVLEILDTPSQPRNPKAMGKLKEWSLILYGTEEPPQGDAPPPAARSPLKREYARSLSGKRSPWYDWWPGSDKDDLQQPQEYMGQCFPECPYCDGPNQRDCFFCVHFSLRNGTERVCVRSCPHGFYGNIALKRCLRCGNFCLACEPPPHSTRPPAGPSTGSTNVTKAPPSGPPACTRCINGTLLLPGSRDCVTSCGYGFYKDTATSSCLSCRPNCTRCSGGPNSCSECSEGYSVQAGSCHVTCPDGTFPGADQQCLPCHKTCSVCGGPREQDCSRCAPTYVLRDGWQCVQECGTGLYPAPCPDSPEQRCCSSCSAHCLRCESAERCLLCERDHELHGNKCEKNTPCLDVDDDSWDGGGFCTLVKRSGLCGHALLQNLCCQSCRTPAQGPTRTQGGQKGPKGVHSGAPLASPL